jgi:cyclin B
VFVPVNRQQPNSYQHGNHHSIVLEQRNTEDDNQRELTQPAYPAIASDRFQPSARDVDSIDKRDTEDPLCATEYVQDMYQYFRSKEEITTVHPLYMKLKQTEINEGMRSILVDWLVDVHLKFKLVPETLYLTINVINRYLELQEVSRSRLQLVGVTSLLIASKYEDIIPPKLRDLVYVCAGVYTRTNVCIFYRIRLNACHFLFFPSLLIVYSLLLFFQVIEMEERILKTLKYSITIPSAKAFLVRFLKAAHADECIMQLSCFILECTLQSYNLLHYLPSQLAAAAVFIVRCTVGRNSWSSTLSKYANYSENDILPIAKAIMHEKDNDNEREELFAVNKKYTSSRYRGVASLTFYIKYY